MTTLQTLAQDFEAALLREGLTRQELAQKAGVSRQAVYRLLKGHDVQVTTLLAVGDVLRLDVMALPKHLVRGLPELMGAQPLGGLHASEASQTPISLFPPQDHEHIPSAVQKRMAQRRDGPWIAKKEKL
jgi:transcriptional regulator with XRE-family HTH domain